MIEHEGHYWLPILPQEMRDAKDKMRATGEPWPDDFSKEYKRLRGEFTKARSDFIGWMRKDRDSRMNTTAKEVLAFLAESLNFDTGRCDPSHKAIADELGLSVRTVERTISRIRLSGWLLVFRRGKMISNFYRLRVSIRKVEDIVDYALSLRETRAEERECRKRASRFASDPTNMADHIESDPTTVRSHDPTNMADHDPTNMAGKPWKGTMEDEPLKETFCSEGSDESLWAYISNLDPLTPLDVPSSEEEAEGILSCASNQNPVIQTAMRKMLMDGTLTPFLLLHGFEQVIS